MEGTHVYLWLIHADVWQKSSQYCKLSPNQNKLIEKQKIIYVDAANFGVLICDLVVVLGPPLPRRLLP